MAGGKGKSHGGKAGPKPGDGQRTQISHSAKAGLQVKYISDRFLTFSLLLFPWSSGLLL